MPVQLTVVGGIVAALLAAILIVSQRSDRVTHPVGTVSVLGNEIARGHCTRGARLEVVDESATTVVIKFASRGEPLGDCLMCEVARLEEPIGDRTSIDETTDTEIGVSDACLDFLRDRP
ncbi:MAG TPA: hypothetical protein VGA13_12650 [Acidimicrobiales bacterium]|jgi:hypothetical protein